MSPDIYTFASGVSVLIIHIDFLSLWFLLLSSLHNSERNSNFRFILMWLMVILLLSYSCQMPSSSVKSCRSNCSTFTEIKHMVDSISQLFGLKGHKASPATQNPECPIFQLSLRVCGMVRGYQWIKSNDFSKILLKIIVVWKMSGRFLSLYRTLVFIKLTALVWITEKQRALFSTLTHSGSPLFYYSAPLTHICEQTWQLPFLTYFLNHDS